MSERATLPINATEQLRIGRLLEAHGDPIGAILAYRLVIEHGAEAAATEARSRVGAIARVAAGCESG